jgi:phosphoglycolate phosphatase
MPLRFPLLVFDWDGTLIDSAAAIVESIQEACRDLDLPVPDHARAVHTIGLGLRQTLEHAVPGLSAEDFPRVAERYRHHFLARDPNLPLFRGTGAMLGWLQETGHVLAIATGKSSAGLARGMRHTGVERYFSASRCADQCASKPAPDMLVELMDELGAEPAGTLMIGDTVHDLQMAANAGVAALAVSHGAHPRENLLAMNPLACAASTGELLHWLQRNA